jgi:hypothetical protein
MNDRASKAKAVCEALLESNGGDEVCNILLCALGTMILTKSEHKAAQLLRMRVFADQLQVDIATKKSP